MASFDGVSFEERGRANGALLPVHGSKAKWALLPVPQSDRVYLQMMGWDTSPLDVPARVTAAQLASLRGKVGTQGTFIYAGGTITAAGWSCTLVDVADVQEVRQPNDVYFCVLKFSLW